MKRKSFTPLQTIGRQRRDMLSVTGFTPLQTIGRQRRDIVSVTGFTLIEVLISIVIFSLLFAAVFEILITGRRAWNIGQVQQELEDQARLGLESMVRELYQSNVDKVKRGFLSQLLKGTGNISRISFKVPIGYDADGNLEWGAEGNKDYSIHYTTSEYYRRLTRHIYNETYGNSQGFVGTYKVLANNVQALQFSIAGDDKFLTINLTTNLTTTDGRMFNQTLTSKVTFRN